MSPVLVSPIRFHSSPEVSYTPRQVANAYGAPAGTDGTGTTIGVIELGGAFNPADFTALGLNPNNVTCLSVDGGRQSSDGPDGADGEVMLDLEVIASVAPGAKIRVYFADNASDTGFLDAIIAAGHECDVISISWGGPENSWDPASIKQFAAAFATLRAHGVTIFAASGDAGADDGTSAPVVDYPAADPNVVGCGGTRLAIGRDGARSGEVVWNDDPSQSATGGGVSKVFPGRAVPDVAGNADPSTGYQVITDGAHAVAGGTSAVAPLYAALLALVRQASKNKPFDFLNIVSTNPAICYDVTSGDNGAYRAGPGRDDVTGWGVVDFSRLLKVLVSGAQVPAPGGGATVGLPTSGGTVTPVTGTGSGSGSGSTGGTGTVVSPPTTPPPGTTGSGSSGGGHSVLTEIEHEIEAGLSAVLGAVRKLKTAIEG